MCEDCTQRQNSARYYVFYDYSRVGNEERQCQSSFCASAAYIQEAQRSAPSVVITPLRSYTISRTGIRAGEDALVVVCPVLAFILVHHYDYSVKLGTLYAMLSGIG